MSSKSKVPKRIAIKPSPNTKIWRYMDFPKFMFLIHHGLLFFPAVKYMEDKFDGSLAVLGIISMSSLSGLQGADVENHDDGPRSNMFVSCWHINEVESAAMWTQYARAGAGIAIQSTVKKVDGCANWSDYEPYEMGKVNYRPKPIKDNNFSSLQACFNKRPSFEHEKEFRVVLSPKRTKERSAYVKKHGGIPVKVNLTTLIEKIYIGPFTPQWIKDLIPAIILNQYKLQIPVVQSDIDKEPFKN